MKKWVALTLALLLILCSTTAAFAEYKIYLTQEAKREMKKYSTLQYGSKGRSVGALQARLVELGYLYDCYSDGYYDDVTEEAVYDFQTTNNLTGSDGVAYPYTQYKLFDEFAIYCGGGCYETLYPGDEGWEVTRLQKRLIDLGYLADGQADGTYGKKTEQAVYDFRVNNCLDPYNGTAEDWVLDALFSSWIESN